MTTVLETPRRFSESRFWDLMRAYYRERGPDAWAKGEVPFQVSSNAAVAAAYADLIVGFLRDRLAAGDGRPVTVVELGAGVGRFGYLLCKELGRQAEALPHLPPVRVILTDVAESNIAAWRGNPRLRALIEDGRLETAVLEVGAETPARLSDGTPLADVLGQGSVVVVANYLLDVLVHDAFRFAAGTLAEVRVGLSLRPEATGPVPQAPADLFPLLRFDEEAVPVAAGAPAVYGDTDLDGILAAYAAELQAETTLLFPIAGLRGLADLEAMAGGPLMLIASDKGYSSALEGRAGLRMRLDGSFATSVNFDAYGRWFERRGGRALRPHAPRERFDTYVFLSAEAGEGPEVAAAYDLAVRRVGPSRYWLLRRDRRRMAQRDEDGPDLATVLAWLALSNHDPEEFVAMRRVLLKAIDGASRSARNGLLQAIDRVWDNHLPIGNGIDPAHAIGRILNRLGQPERALTFFAASVDEYGPHPATALAMAISFDALGRVTEAVAHYRVAAELPSQKAKAEAAIARLTGQAGPG